MLENLNTKTNEVKKPSYLDRIKNNKQKVQTKPKKLKQIKNIQKKEETITLPEININGDKIEEKNEEIQMITINGSEQNDNKSENKSQKEKSENLFKPKEEELKFDSDKALSQKSDNIVIKIKEPEISKRSKKNITKSHQRSKKSKNINNIKINLKKIKKDLIEIINLEIVIEIFKKKKDNLKL